MTDATARRLFDVLTNCELMHQLHGRDRAEFLRREANRHLGETRRELLRVAALGPGIERWISIFLDSLQPETFTPKPGAHHAPSRQT